MHDDLNICTDDPWRSPFLSESGPHLTVVTHSHNHTLEPVITNNLTPSTISISSILLFSHPLFFQFTSSKIFFKTPVLQSIDPTTFSLFFTNLESMAHHYTPLFWTPCQTLNYLVPSSPIIITRQTPNLDKSYRHIIHTGEFFNSADWPHYTPMIRDKQAKVWPCNPRPFLYSPEWLLLLSSH